MLKKHNVRDSEHVDEGSYKSYICGFIASIVFTLLPYWMVVSHQFSKTVVLVAVIGSAIAQLFVQLVFFLHLNRSSAQRWNVMSLLFALMIVAIIIGGSLWIMTHLNYNMMMNSNPYQK